MVAERSSGLGYGHFGGGEEFVRRAGTVAQRRHTRKATMQDSALPPLPLPGTPTSSEFDSPQINSNRSSPDMNDSSGTSPATDEYSTISQSFDMDNFNVPAGMAPIHIPLRKNSATNLREQAYPGAVDYIGTTDSGSPIRSIFPERISSRTNSPRLRRDRQAASSSKDELPLASPKEEASPYAVPRGRARGMTTITQRTPTFDSQKRSPSIPDLRANERGQVSSIYKPERGPGNGSRNQSMTFRSPPPPAPWSETEEGRSSYKSSQTNTSQAGHTSSGYYEPSETDRTSVVTRSSSASDFSKTRVLSEDEDEDDGYDLDDMISMYANGFTDDAMAEKLDNTIEDIRRYSPPSPLPPSHFSQQTPKAELPRFDFDRPMTVAVSTKYDSKFDSDFPLKRTPSLPHLPAAPSPRSPSLPQMPAAPSPLLSHPVNPAAPPSPISPFIFDNSLHREPVSPMDYAPVEHSPIDFDTPIDQTPHHGFPFVLPPPLPPLEPSSMGTSPMGTPPTTIHPRQFTAKPEPLSPVPRDRYGFKKVTAYVTEQEYDAWNVGYTDYLERRKTKWEIMMMQWGLTIEEPVRFPPRSDKVKRYIRKGIPVTWRGACWFWYAGGPSRLAANPGVYDILVERAGNGDVSDTDRESIERDLNRTFPDNIQFKPDPTLEVTQDFTGNFINPDGPNGDLPIIKALRRVLQAFAIHNPSIGYCQSLNFIAGMLLIFLRDEEKSFHMLNIITTVHLPGTHAKILEANVDVGVLMTCIKDSMPAVWTKIDDINEGRGAISTSRLPTVSLATTAWFMSCFIGNLPTESVLRVWDSFFYEGSKTLFRIALAVFKTGESEIRNVNEHMEIFQVVQAIPRKLLDANALMEGCYKRRNGFGHLSQDIIDSRRKERRTQLRMDRDRKNGQINPGLALVGKGGDGEARPASRGRSGTLKRAASRARLGRAKSKVGSPIVVEPMPAQF